MADVAAGAAGRWFTADFIAREPAVVAAMTEQLRAISPEGYAACCDVLAVADLRGSVGAITVPLLVIAGEFDPVTTVDDARFIAERVQGAKVAVVPASHLSNIEAPGAFNSAVLDFLKG
jgi:3-oxoadipate enol-lactonase